MIRHKLLIAVMSFLLMMFVTQIASAQDDAETEAQTPEEICDSVVPVSDPETRSYDQPENVLEVGVDYYAIFCTDVGPVYVDLFETFTPVTVNNFVFLSENGYYNNTMFHRVIENFMAQGGDPTATGTGGPGYSFEDEFVSFLTFDRVGLLAMANSGANTNGSQFFLTTFVTDWLNYRHTIFGDVLYGQNVVESIPVRDPSSPEPGTMLDTVVIITDSSSVDVGSLSTDEAPVNQADFEASIENLPELPESLVYAESTGVLGTDSVAALAGEMETDLGTLLIDNNHQFSVAAQIQNAECDLDLAGFAQAGVMIHVFESDAHAQAIVSGESLELIATLGQEGFEHVETNDSLATIYSADTDACGQDGTLGYMVRWNGRFVIVSEVLVPSDPGSVEQWFAQVVNPQVFDIVFGAEFERELRNR